MAANAATGRRFFLLLAAALAAGLAVAYSNGFGIGFYFDDGYGVRDNPAIRSLANIPRFFTDPFTLTSLRENVDVRPVLVTTYALNWAVSGADPWSYHAFNLVVHFAAALLVFVLVRDHLWWPASTRGPGGEAQWPAAAAALLFALAPINNQPLNYMWARSALLCTAFYLAAFHSLLSGRLVAALLLQVLALLTKVIALTLPAVFVAYAWLYRDRTRQRGLGAFLADWRRLALPVGAMLAVDAACLVHRKAVLPDWADDRMREAWVTPWIWFTSQWPALLHYVRIFVWPEGLSIDSDFPYVLSIAEPRAWGSLLLLLAWAGAALRWSERVPHVAFASAWFFVTLAPESTFVPLAEVVNDHRPYIASSLGLSVLGAWLLDGAASLAGRRRLHVFVAALAAVSVAFALAGRARTAEWGDPARLWESTVVASPRNGRAWMNAGLAHMRRGDYATARRYFETARGLVPHYPYLFMNLAVLEQAEGRPEAALAWAREAVRLGDHLSLAHLHLGKALEANGRKAEAVAAYRRARQIDPNADGPRAALARLEATGTSAPGVDDQARLMAEGLRLLDDEGDADAALLRFGAILRLNPDHYGAHWQVARALDAAGRQAEADEAWRRMLDKTIEAGDAAAEAKVRARLSR